MASNTAGVCTTFRKDLLNGSHAFGAQAAGSARTITTRDVFALALYRVTSGLGTSVTSYGATGETTSSGYTAGGATCATTDPAASGNTAYWTPSASISWTNVTMTGSNAVDQALLYNSSSTAKLAIAQFLLGTVDVGQAPSAGTFTLTMPTNDQTTGLIRIT